MGVASFGSRWMLLDVGCEYQDSLVLAHAAKGCWESKGEGDWNIGMEEWVGHLGEDKKQGWSGT